MFALPKASHIINWGMRNKDENKKQPSNKISLWNNSDRKIMMKIVIMHRDACNVNVYMSCDAAWLWPHRSNAKPITNNKLEIHTPDQIKYNTNIAYAVYRHT